MNVGSIIDAYFRGEKSEAALILLAGASCLAGLGPTVDHYAEARAAGYLRGLEAAGTLEAP